MAVAEPALVRSRPSHIVGRYAVYGKLAAGGMATVHFGRLLGPVGFSRTVAIKRLHPQFAKDPEFVAMFLDEARVAARIQHPNVVSTIDVVALDQELFLVMEYIRGESFSRLLRRARKSQIPISLGVVGAIMSGALHGLHAAHHAKDERGQPLNVVHRDMSPQNIIVGVDGVPRVLDFGVAKAAARQQITRDGQMKGKLSYMSPEQVQARGVDQRSDVFAAGIVFWEALTGRRLFQAEDASGVLQKLLAEPIPSVGQYVPDIPVRVEEIVLKALAREPSDRFQSAREFALAVEESMALISSRELGEWVERVAGDTLLERERAVAEIESVTSISEISRFSEDHAPYQPEAGSGQEAAISSRRLAAQHAPPSSRGPGVDREADDDAQTRIFDPENSTAPSVGAPSTLVVSVGEATDIDNQEVFQRMRRQVPFRGIVMGTAVLGIGLVLGTLLFGGARTRRANGRIITEAPAASPLNLSSDSARGKTSALAGTATDFSPRAEIATKPSARATTPVVGIDALPRAALSKPELPALAVPQGRAVDPAATAPQTPATTARALVTAPPALVAPRVTKPSPCETPYTVDTKGIRRIKPECL